MKAIVVDTCLAEFNVIKLNEWIVPPEVDAIEHLGFTGGLRGVEYTLQYWNQFAISFSDDSMAVYIASRREWGWTPG